MFLIISKASLVFITIVVLPPDEGNATVIMNRTDYEEKMKVILQDPAYKKTMNDPTTYLEKTTKWKIEYQYLGVKKLYVRTFVRIYSNFNSKKI